MTRFSMAAALGALILSSTAALAATPATSTTAARHRAPVNYIQQCGSLAGQWKAALDSHGLSPNLGKAKADAAKGEKFCKSGKVSQQRRGVADYRAALKVLGVKPA